jgi:hypothetical protein
MHESLGYLFIALVVGVVVFLLGREVVCWYWKINDIVDVLRKIEQHLASIERHSAIAPTSQMTPTLQNYGTAPTTVTERRTAVFPPDVQRASVTPAMIQPMGGSTPTIAWSKRQRAASVEVRDASMDAIVRTLQEILVDRPADEVVVRIWLPEYQQQIIDACWHNGQGFRVRGDVTFVVDGGGAGGSTAT